MFVHGQGGVHPRRQRVEMALWGLAGKASGLPIHTLMGGKMRRSRVPVYPDAANPAIARRSGRKPRPKASRWGLDYSDDSGRSERLSRPGPIIWHMTNNRWTMGSFLPASARSWAGVVEIALRCHAHYGHLLKTGIQSAHPPDHETHIEPLGRSPHGTTVPDDNADSMCA